MKTSYKGLEWVMDDDDDDWYVMDLIQLEIECKLHPEYQLHQLHQLHQKSIMSEWAIAVSTRGFQINYLLRRKKQNNYES